MLRLGAAGAGGLLLSAAGRTADLPGVVQGPLTLGSDPLRPAPAAPVAAPSAPAGVNAPLVQRAKAAL
ncbi:MAG TPA: hypothetical protein VM760_04155, partial [Sphingomicrobium sp.]|nr:hypothetical protein [Sphingomicrobium sp.]